MPRVDLPRTVGQGAGGEARKPAVQGGGSEGDQEAAASEARVPPLRRDLETAVAPDAARACAGDGLRHLQQRGPLPRGTCAPPLPQPAGRAG